MKKYCFTKRGYTPLLERGVRGDFFSRLTFSTLLLLLLPLLSHAVPQSMNYQGVYRENGIPVTGDRPMTFKICDSLAGSCAGTCQAGNACLWTSGEINVNISTGVFRTSLTFTVPVDWGSITPYLEVSVGTTTLLPRDPITSTAYAFFASTAQALVTGSGQITAAPNRSGINVSTHLFVSEGNIGIGTTNPSGSQVRLGGETLYGRVIAMEFEDLNALSLENTAFGLKSGIFQEYNRGEFFVTFGSISNDDASIKTNNIERLTVDSAGDVGIGTPDPGATLDVKAWSGNTYAINVSSNNGTGLMVVQHNGNVGIGTTAPNAKLQVSAGDAAVTTQGNGVILRDTDGTGCHRLTVNSAGSLTLTVVTCP